MYFKHLHSLITQQKIVAVFFLINGTHTPGTDEPVKLTIFNELGLHREWNWSEFSPQRQPGIKVIKLFSCSTQLSTKFIMLIKVKMPRIVDIITFKSMINATSERLKASNFIIFRYFSFYE